MRLLTAAALVLTCTSPALHVHDEVVDPATQKLGPGQIRDANRSMLLAASSQAGAQVCAAYCSWGLS